MKQDRISPRRATNVSLDRQLLDEARALGVNLSRACEKGLAEEVAEARRAAWLRDNAEAIAGWNDYIEKHGLPLAEYRLL